jgi:hypothetical protein
MPIKSTLITVQRLVDQVEYLLKRNARLDKENEGLLYANNRLEDANAQLERKLSEINNNMVGILSNGADCRTIIYLPLLSLMVTGCWYDLQSRPLITVR